MKTEGLFLEIKIYRDCIRLLNTACYNGKFKSRIPKSSVEIIINGNSIVHQLVGNQQNISHGWILDVRFQFV